MEPGRALGGQSTHAALPFVAPRSGGGLDLYYSPRDASNRAHVVRTPLDVSTGRPAASGETATLLDPGRSGTFDESGTTMSCVTAAPGGDVHLFYTGWTLGVTVPFYFFTGRAVSRDGGVTFTRESEAPLLERTSGDPFLTASPHVLLDNGVWRMWYVSCVGWEELDEGPRHQYLIKYAESNDGQAWRRTGHIAIPFASRDEYALSRPCVVAHDDGYRMWFSARGDGYRLAYAESTDGLEWERRDDLARLDPGESGWDSEMVAYPWVHQHGDTEWLFYNGNGYGRSGIGWASRAVAR